MKTNVRQTSIEAYKNLDACKSRKTIVNALKRVKSSCIADLAVKLNMDKSGVSARLNELAAAGIIELDGRKPSRATKIKANHWRLQWKNQN